MTTRLAPYGLSEYASTVAKVGKGKAVPALAARMPSREIVAKVGMDGISGCHAERRHRVIRRKAGVHS